jgi:hypothetical protein
MHSPSHLEDGLGTGQSSLRTLGAASALVVFAFAVSACGSAQKTDAGGFTRAQRTAAQSALDLTQNTPIPSRVVALSYQTGTAPSTCTVLPKTGQPGTFRLLVAWTPNHPGYLGLPESVLAATIDESSARRDSFDVVTYRNRSGKAVPEPVRVSAGFVRAALTKPAEQCEVLDNGKLQLVSS